MRFLLSAIASLLIVGANAAAPTCDLAVASIASPHGCGSSNKEEWSINVDAGVESGSTTYAWSTAAAGVTFSQADAQLSSVVVTRTANTCANGSIPIHVVKTNPSGTITCTIDLKMSDSIAPVISWVSGLSPSPYTELEFGGDDAIPTAETCEATDDCDSAATCVYVEVEGEPTGDGAAPDAKKLFSLTRTWTTTDSCGNADTFTAVIDLIDTTAPVFDAGLEENLAYDCDADIPACQPTVTDDGTQDVAVILSSSTTTKICEQSYTTINVYTAEDDAGNSNSFTQTILVTDSTAPELTGLPTDQEISISCELIDLYVPAQVAAVDLCDKAPVVIYDQSVSTVSPVGEEYTLLRTWTATDACGNSASSTQTISVVDNEAPTLPGLAPDITEECGAHPPMFNNSDCVQTVFDKCDDSPSVQMAETRINGTCANEYMLLHAFTVSDNVGNTDVLTRTVTVVDNSIPVLIGVPADTTAACVPPIAAAVTARDACEPEVTSPELTENKLDADNYNYRFERVWVATDACGHTDTATQTIIVSDDDEPAFAVMPTTGITVDCLTVPAYPTQTVTDDCHPYTNPYDQLCSEPVPHTFDEQTIPGECAEEYQLLRTWDTNDCAGNTNQHQQLITVTSARPTLGNLPQDVAAHEFGDSLPTPQAVTAADDCTDVGTPQYTARTVLGSCENSYQVLRTWSVSDTCGVPTTHTQTINVVDTTPPVVVQPDDRTTTCNADPADWTTTASDAYYTSSTLEVEVTCDADVDGSCDYAGSRTCYFSTTDACGNTHFVTATDNWDDTAPPTLTCAAAMDYNATLNSNSSVTVDDNCDDGVELVYASATSLGNECTLISTFHESWSATDNCGNVATECLENTPEWDVDVPTMDPPEDETYSCRTDTIPDHGDITGIDNYAGQTAGDEWTTDVLFTRNRNKIDSTPCGFRWKTVWDGQDCTGNANSYTHFATVMEANEASDIWFELNGTVVDFATNTERSYDIECPSTPSADDFEVHTTCDGKVADITPDRKTITPAVPRTEDVTVYEYTWTWTDGCHSITETQTVAVIDTTPPTINVTDATSDCSINEASVAATATDDCDTAVVCEAEETVYGDRTTSCYTVINDWTCTDDNGLTDTGVQTISVVDEAAPLFDTHPVDTIGHCPYTPANFDLDWSDNCDMGGSTTSTYGTLDNSEVGVMARYRYIWEQADSCGAITEQIQSIRVMDILPPNFIAPPADETVNCSGTKGAAPTCEDDCQDDCTIVELSSVNVPSDTCEYIGAITTIWNVVDQGGNTENYTQVVTYKDDEIPDVQAYTIDDVTLEYDDATVDGTGFDNWNASAADGGTNPASLFVPVDNCDPDPVVTCTYTTSGDHCQTIHVWSCVVTDICGNSKDLGIIRNVYLNDPRSPGLFDPDTVDDAELDNVPADVTIECDQPIPAQATLTSGVGIVHASMDDGDSADYRACRERIHTWTVSYCAREDHWYQTITIQDNKAPVITDPVYQSTECSLVEQGSPDVVDSCEGSITAVVTDDSENIGHDDCGLSVVRTIDAVDKCGNRAIKRTSITVLDVTPPQIHGASGDYTSEAPYTPNPVILTADDNCEVVTLDYTEETVQGSCPHDYDIVRNWVATDLCGLTDSRSQTIEISDNTEPTFSSYPQNTTRYYENPYDEVDRDLWDLTEVPVLTADDDADGDMGTITPEEWYDNDAGLANFTKFRTWTVTDSCGNVEYWPTQTIVISLPPCQVQDIDVPCADSGELLAGGLYDPADWISNCTEHLADAVSIAYTMETTESTGCPNEYHVIRAYTLSDVPESGSEETLEVVQTITIFDTQKPYFTDKRATPSESVTLTKDLCEPVIPDFSAEDVCGDVTVTKTTDRSQDAAWPTTYTATDSCGNIDTYVFTQNLIHAAFPEWTSALPQDSSALDNDLCDDPTPETLTCQGFCGYTATVTLPVHNAVGSCPTKSTRQWTCTDSYGQAIHHHQTVLYADATPPVVVASPDLECSCLISGITDGDWNTIEGGQGAAFASDCVITATASDNCDGVLTAIDEGCTMSTDNNVFSVYTCTWSVTDTCGNRHEDSGDRKMFKNNDPTWDTVVADYTAECSDIAFDTPTATDDCDAGTLTYYETSERVDLDSCNTTTNLYQLIRTFTVTDDDSAAITQQQTITVRDMTPPTLAGDHLPHDGQHYQCELPTMTVTVSDDCDSTLTGTVVPVETPTPAPRGYMHNFKWYSQDECGHVTIDEIDIRREDTTDPTFTDTTGQQDLTILCHDEIPVRTDPLFEDNCEAVLGDAVLTYEETIDGAPCEGQVNTRVWTITDTVGNFNTHTQVISWNIRTAPVCSSGNDDQHVECDTDYDDPQITCDDPCTDGFLDIGYTKNIEQPQLIQQCGQNEDGWVRYTSTADQCGRTTLIKVRRQKTDTTPPVFDTFPVGGYKDCMYMEYDEPTNSDNCGDATITEVVSMDENDNACGGIRNITYTSTDECGLTTVDWFVRTWADVDDPILDSKPDSHTIECTDEFPVYQIHATDNCDGPLTNVNHTTKVITNNLPYTLDPAITKVVQYNWEVFDDCGNDDTHVMTVIQQDTTPPTITGDFDPIVVECTEYSVPAAVAIDDCDIDPDERWSTEKVASCGHTGTIVVTYIATDFAGLTDTEYKTITVVDITAPSITFNKEKDDLTFECDEPAFVPPVCTAHSEPCVGAATPACTMTSETVSATRTTSVEVFTWSASDDCGNTVTAYQTITRIDTVEPDIEWDEYIYKDCTLAGFEPSADAFDLCDDRPVLTQRNPTKIHQCTGIYNETFYWVAEDEQGNRNQTETVVIYTDVTAPLLFVNGTDLTSECDIDPVDPTASCTDDCSPCTVELAETTGYDNSECKNYEQTFTFSLYDDCGNEGDPVTVTHTFEDTTNPIITATGDGSNPFYTISAGAAHTDMPTMDTYDACSGATFTFDTTESASEDGCTSTHVRTWFSDDACGNQAFWSQTITVEEDVKPRMDGVVPSITVECGDDNWMLQVPKPTAKDRVGNYLDVQSASTTTQLSACGCDKQHIVFWSVTDDCANTQSATTTVVVEDTTPPSFTCVPDDQRVQCASERVDSTVTATDASVVGVITATMSHVDVDAGCGQSVIKTFVATDCSSNTNTYVQTILVKDDNTPVFTRVPADETIECGCGTIPPAATLKAIDNCDEIVTATTTEETEAGAGSEYKLLRTYEAVDSCGNSAEAFQTITVTDTIAPTIHGCGSQSDLDDVVNSDYTLPSKTCELVAMDGSLDEPTRVYADDDCDAAPSLSYTQTKTGEICTGVYVIEHLWESCDATGNCVNATEKQPVEDTEAPNVLPTTSVPECLRANDLYYQEDVDILFPWYDNCDGDDQVTLTMVSCNSTQVAVGDTGAFTEDCALSTDMSKISIKGEASNNADRVYTVWASLTDTCGNSRTVSKAFTVVASNAEAATAGCAEPTEAAAAV